MLLQIISFVLCEFEMGKEADGAGYGGGEHKKDDDDQRSDTVLECNHSHCVWIGYAQSYSRGAIIWVYLGFMTMEG